MATNDFLPFAGGSGANVIDQTTYAGLSSLLANGFSSGVAQSAQLNKVWRQSSIMASVLAQFIASNSGQNATDDGTTATLLANLVIASKAVSTSQFTGTNQQLSSTGYQKLPGGLIVQWGIASPTDSNGNKSVTFPLAFPTNCFMADACVAAAQADNPCLMSVNSITKTGFVVNAKTYAGSWQPFVGAGGYWIVFGN